MNPHSKFKNHPVIMKTIVKIISIEILFIELILSILERIISARIHLKLIKKEIDVINSNKFFISTVKTNVNATLIKTINRFTNNIIFSFLNAFKYVFTRRLILLS